MQGSVARLQKSACSETQNRALLLVIGMLSPSLTPQTRRFWLGHLARFSNLEGFMSAKLSGFRHANRASDFSFHCCRFQFDGPK